MPPSESGNHITFFSVASDAPKSPYITYSTKSIQGRILNLAYVIRWHWVKTCVTGWCRPKCREITVDSLVSPRVPQAPHIIYFTIRRQGRTPTLAYVIWLRWVKTCVSRWCLPQRRDIKLDSLPELVSRKSPYKMSFTVSRYERTQTLQTWRPCQLDE